MATVMVMLIAMAMVMVIAMVVVMVVVMVTVMVMVGERNVAQAVQPVSIPTLYCGVIPKVYSYRMRIATICVPNDDDGDEDYVGNVDDDVDGAPSMITAPKLQRSQNT